MPMKKTETKKPAAPAVKKINTPSPAADKAPAEKLAPYLVELKTEWPAAFAFFDSRNAHRGAFRIKNHVVLLKMRLPGSAGIASVDGAGFGCVHHYTSDEAALAFLTTLTGHSSDGLPIVTGEAT